MAEFSTGLILGPLTIFSKYCYWTSPVLLLERTQKAATIVTGHHPLLLMELTHFESESYIASAFSLIKNLNVKQIITLLNYSPLPGEQITQLIN